MPVGAFDAKPFSEAISDGFWLGKDDTAIDVIRRISGASSFIDSRLLSVALAISKKL